MRFAMNHIVAPKLPIEAFIAMAGRLGATDVEIRNDLPNVVGTASPEEVRDVAERAGVAIISINALYPFNVWSGDLAEKAVSLADYAQACGAKALVMCPLNDGGKVSFEVLVAALKTIKPILQDRNLTGLVEPLGFPISSMRTKKEAVAAIEDADGEAVFKLVHDTFHHHLAGETEFFPEWTGIVHISGVIDPGVAVSDMLDPHRVLVDQRDRLENLAQIRTLLAAGVEGPYSYEPFAPEIHQLTDPETAIRQSMEFIKARL
jgi:2-keto-myo-inositol isomerase